MRCYPFKVEITGRVQVGSMDGGLDALVEILVILLGFRHADAVTLRNLFGSLLHRGAFHHMKGELSRSGIQVQDGSRIDDKNAGAIF